MKKYMFLVLAAIGLAACTNDDLGGDNGPAHSGEIEESYIAINLSAAGGTRAEDGEDGYLDGTDLERQVESAHFFFFRDGAAFPVNVTGGTVDKPGTVSDVNHLAATIDLGPNTGTAPNISDIKEAVLLLKSYKGEYPNQIVAVLNWTPADQAYDLNELEMAVNLHGPANNDEYFVMSNSVYLAGNNVINATPLTVDKIYKEQGQAMADPVQIYVERVAAKVTVTSKNDATKFQLGESVKVYNEETHEYDDVQVYAHLLGWELHLDNSQSYLLKKINAAWTIDGLGFTWNDSPYRRSYWATSLDAPSGTGESFRMTYNDFSAQGFYNQYGFAVGKSSTIASGTFTEGSYTYIGENTTYNPNAAENSCTKVILKAKLGDVNGNALEIAKWMGQQYVGNKNLRTAIANTLKYTLYYKDGDNYHSITPEDLVCIAGGNGTYADIIDDNMSYVQLSDITGYGVNKEWYKLANGVYSPVAATLTDGDPKSVKATNEYLAKNVAPSVLYTSGETFYYVDIRHLAPKEDDSQPGGKTPGDYGIVRNHVYNVIVNAIGGFGSPVYVGNSNLVVPEYPEIPEQETFVSAQINILSWRLVNQEVDIQPAN